MRIDVIDTPDAFEALRPNWDRLYAADPEGQFFLSWIWLSQLFERRPKNWCVLAAADEAAKDYVAFLPLRLKLSLIHISEPTRQRLVSRMPSSA